MEERDEIRWSYQRLVAGLRLLGSQRELTDDMLRTLDLADRVKENGQGEKLVMKGPGLKEWATRLPRYYVVAQDFRNVELMAGRQV